ncbi:MAG: methyltransferase domain-containing protein [Ignavibacteria bacterium]
MKKIESETYPEPPSFQHDEITKQTFNWIISQYRLSKDSRILDVGCGQGVFLKLAESHGYNPIGITLNDEDKKVCNELGYEVYKMDQSFLDFPDNHFDMIWARHVLEHSIFPMFTLSEFNRVLRNDGLLYLEVPMCNSPAEHEGNPNHYSVLTKKMWISLINRIGYSINNTFDIKFEIQAGEEEYWSFVCQKKDVEQKEKKENKLFLALSAGENFGWGVCSKYLNKEVPKIYNDTTVWDFKKLGNVEKEVDGTVFHALTGIEFQSLSKIWGKRNVGYTFFENELIDSSHANSEKYDMILGGCTWCRDKLKEKGITNTDVLIQGIDPEIFYPIEEEKDEDLFVIFSGGKFELRKSQDLILNAIKILQQKYNDIVLINAWYNMWPQTMELVARSNHIRFELEGDKWIDRMNHLYEINGIDKNKILTYELIPNTELREFYKQTDIGIFPNRCEGGTNLVLMEYMACGKPVIASYTSGHKDIVNEQNSLLLKDMQPYKIYSNNRLWADWEEPSIDEIISQVEYAYHNRNEIKKIGRQAGKDLQKFTWTNTAEKLVSIINSL